MSALVAGQGKRVTHIELQAASEGDEALSRGLVDGTLGISEYGGHAVGGPPVAGLRRDAEVGGESCLIRARPAEQYESCRRQRGCQTSQVGDIQSVDVVDNDHNRCARQMTVDRL
ncbi:hypothetical protein [Streptomyces olivaceiscleroticus]|uniref:hypothetical protein n=1 Tax=Streptomyces olivaceiscleroticus TaxID=68245 RepID=UPI0031F73296